MTVEGVTHTEHGAGGESVDPVLVPEQVQQMRVQRRLEVTHLQRVVPAAESGERAKSEHGEIDREKRESRERSGG